MKTKTEKMRRISDSQSGVTLLLAILVLSAIMAISFSLATIIFIEVRTSGDLVRTEGAIFGADAVSEQVLFKVKRKTPDFFPAAINLKNKVVVDKPVENDFTSTTTYDTVFTSANTLLTAKTYSLFDPASPAGGSKFAKLRISNLSTGSTLPLKIYICQFDAGGTVTYQDPPCTNENSIEYWIDSDAIGSVIAGPGPKYQNLFAIPISPSGSMEWFLDIGKQQQIFLVNESAAVVPVKIETFGPTVSDPKPMPLVGEVNVPIKADSSGAVRRIDLRIPYQ